MSNISGTISDEEKQKLRDMEIAFKDKMFVPQQIKESSLATALYYLSKNAPFFSHILQSLDVEYSYTLPTAGVKFNNNSKKWELFINPYFFCTIFPQNDEGNKYRQAVLLHEIYHLTHQHLTRVAFANLQPFTRQLLNIAMDMSINQYIPNLPSGCSHCPSPDEKAEGAQCQNEMCPGSCIDVKHYYDTDPKTGNKIPWETERPFEYYYYKLSERYSDVSYKIGYENGQQDGPGEDGKIKTLPKHLDSHDWGNESASEKDMLDATEELVKRAVQKMTHSHSSVPGFVKDLLSELEARKVELDYKRIIHSAIRKNATGTDRINTWTKPSRRYGELAPGTKTGPLPKLAFFADTSGSISVDELNDFLSIIDNFLKVGHRKCFFGLWHTKLYRYEPYKLGMKFNSKDLQSGGTDVEPCLKQIYQEKHNLAIILTDGYFSDVDIKAWTKPGKKFPQILWIISKNGNENHPMKHLGHTIKIPNHAHLKKDVSI